MRQAVVQSLRSRWALAAVSLLPIVAIACYLLWPEPAERKVRRLLAELIGAPPAESGFFGGPRSHEQIFAELDRLGARALPALLETLDQSHDASLRCVAIEQLSKVGDWQAVPSLIRALEDESGAVQRLAATALGQLRASAAIDSLIECLDSSDSSLRCCAADSLGLLGDRRALEPLALRMNDSELCVRRATVESLIRLGDPRAIPYLIAALEEDESPWVRGLAVQGLLNFGDPIAIPALRTASHDTSDHVQEEARRAVLVLTRKCRGQSAELGATAVATDPTLETDLP